MTTDARTDFAELGRRLRASTVTVHDERGRGLGSGVIWDARGLVVTNAHVVRGAHATVVVADGRRVRAALIGRDANLDLAALRIRGGFAADGDAADVRDAATLVPGELVVAVGNPHGLTGAVTAGVVHRRSARWVVADVRLAPGNSGGPLADANGRVAGINSMIVRGLAYAVPSNAVVAFLRALGADARAA